MRKREEWVTLPFSITVLSSSAESLCERGNILYSHATASFGTTTSKSLATRGRLHAYTKSMCSCSLSFLGGVCEWHSYHTITYLLIFIKFLRLSRGHHNTQAPQFTSKVRMWCTNVPYTILLLVNCGACVLWWPIPTLSTYFFTLHKFAKL
jgi:hypothetical protein